MSKLMKILIGNNPDIEKVKEYLKDEIPDINKEFFQINNNNYFEEDYLEGDYEAHTIFSSINTVFSTFLRQAVSMGRLDICKLLIENGADVNLQCPLLPAVQSNLFEIVELLIENGADVKEFCKKYTNYVIRYELQNIKMSDLLFKEN